jgi:hypothetical protein
MACNQTPQKQGGVSKLSLIWGRYSQLLLGFGMALANAIFHQTDEFLLAKAFVFLGKYGPAVMHADFARAGKCPALWPTLKGPGYGHRQDGRPGSDCQAGETGPKFFYLPVGRASSLGKNQNHFVAFKTPERFLDAGYAKSLAVDGDGIDRSDEPGKGGEAEESFAGQIIHVPPAGHAHQGRIQMALVIGQHEHAAFTWNIFLARVANTKHQYRSELHYYPQKAIPQAVGQ